MHSPSAEESHRQFAVDSKQGCRCQRSSWIRSPGARGSYLHALLESGHLQARQSAGQIVLTQCMEHRVIAPLQLCLLPLVFSASSRLHLAVRLNLLGCACSRGYVSRDKQSPARRVQNETKPGHVQARKRASAIPVPDLPDQSQDGVNSWP